MSERAALESLARGEHGDPFSLLGLRCVTRGRESRWLVRTFQPGAAQVELVDPLDGRTSMRLVHQHGIFEVELPAPVPGYRLRVCHGEHAAQVDDPYRFPSTLADLEHRLMNDLLYEVLGAHVITVDGVDGVRFAVWAPAARRVSVVGDFNAWDGRRHVMRRHPSSGIWEIFLPGVAAGARYKFEILAADGTVLPLKSDPFARRMERPPGNASCVHRSTYDWQDRAWMETRERSAARDRPITIYEVHLGSWRRERGRWLSYRELASTLVPYAAEMGYTHLELLPITEHPFDGSWGYQPIGLFAPTWRFGPPDDFKHFVDCCHLAGLGVIVDWVPAHFPKDSHGLARFDGSHLYEHADPRQGEHRDWGTLIFNYGRTEVASYLIASALLWVEEYHVDALRVDAVASMLYLDYSREPGEWVPNAHGGNENLEAVGFMRRLNVAVHAHGAVTMAEESTAWPLVSRPAEMGGLGYSYKWNMGWMHDTLAYLEEDPVHRRHHHERLTFGMLYAHTENFVLPLSHDEVVHGKRSLLGRMPGDTWQQFANLRLAYGFMYAWPGKKLLFMGGELAQGREWDADGALDWDLLRLDWHAGVQRLVRDLNHLYCSTRALHEQDCEPAGFEWIDCEDRAASVVSFVRRGRSAHDIAVVVCNFTPVPRAGYRVGVPYPGGYREALNTDGREYRGSGVGNAGRVQADPQPAHGRPASIALTIPPLAVLVLVPV